MTLDDLAREIARLLDRDIHAGYAIVKAEARGEQRYTLGIAYPANEVDAHGEFASASALEQAAWSALGRGVTAGIQHRPGTDGAGRVVESYIWRAAETRIGDETVKPGDWLVGCLWSSEAWAAIKAGTLTGYSIQGVARVKE